MAIKVTKENSRAYEEVQSAIKNLDDAIASLSTALKVDTGIVEVLTEYQRRDMARTTAGLLMHREDLMGLGINEAVHRSSFVNCQPTL